MSFCMKHCNVLDYVLLYTILYVIICTKELYLFSLELYVGGWDMEFGRNKRILVIILIRNCGVA
jgi:hypothetical protein